TLRRRTLSTSRPLTSQPDAPNRWYDEYRPASFEISKGTYPWDRSKQNPQLFSMHIQKTSTPQSLIIGIAIPTFSRKRACMIYRSSREAMVQAQLSASK